MNILKKIYCRIFQTCFRIALPVLPYREPELIDGFKHVPEVLKKHHISHILLVTDPGVYKLGLTKPLEKQLLKSEISCTIYKDTVANPTSANIEEAKDLYLAHGCQALLAFGWRLFHGLCQSSRCKTCTPEQTRWPRWKVS